MPEFLTTKSTASEIERVIYKAKKEIVIVSPFLKINKTFYERLEDASESGVPITIIYGKDDLKSRERKSLYKLGSLSLYFFENLHAKCYFNESNLIITSMNMHDFSEKNNREMGVLFNSDYDKDVYADAVKEVKSILRIAEEDYIGKKVSKENKEGYSSKQLGYCLRCENRIEFNIGKPYCIDCYNVWNVYGNIKYTENVCHCCGEYEETSFEKPQCFSCYKKNGGWVTY